MKSLFRAASAIALAATPLAFVPHAIAQVAVAEVETVAPTAPSATATPALWVVKDDDTTIYLFGTVHVLSPDLKWFDGAVKSAFDASDEMVTEIGTMPDQATAQPLLVKYGMTTDGPTLTERLPAQHRDGFVKTVTGFGLPMQMVDRFQPWFAGTQLGMIAIVKAGFHPSSGVEAVLTKAATEAKKPISGVETMEAQFQIFSGLSDEAQIRFLTESLDQLDNVGPQLQKMVDAWAKGDADALAKIMNDSLESSPELSKALLLDRNTDWAAWIDDRLDKPGTVFMAVGAGHLAGPDSVQNLLAKRQITAERIEY